MSLELGIQNTERFRRFGNSFIPFPDTDAGYSDLKVSLCKNDQDYLALSNADAKEIEIYQIVGSGGGAEWTLLKTIGTSAESIDGVELFVEGDEPKVKNGGKLSIVYSVFGSNTSKIIYLKDVLATDPPSVELKVGVSGKMTSIASSSNGRYVACGFANVSTGGVLNGGVVHVFDLSAQTKSLQTIVGAGRDDRLGSSVDLSNDGSVLAIGATEIPSSQEGSSDKEGYVRVYFLNDTKTMYVSKIQIDGLKSNTPDVAAGDYSGFSVALSGNGKRIAIGARKSNNSDLHAIESGHVAIFDLTTNSEGTVSKTSVQTIKGIKSYEHVGSAVALSSAGDILVVGSAERPKIYRFNDLDKQFYFVDETADRPFVQWKLLKLSRSINITSDGNYIAVGGKVSIDGQLKLAFFAYRWAMDDIICFKEGTKITCCDEETKEDCERRIETLREGMFVKTYKHGYIRVKKVASRTIKNPGDDDRTLNRIYKCAASDYPDLKEDLYLTGCHALLVDNISSHQYEKSVQELGQLYITDGKYRLMAMLDDKAKPWNKEENVKVWHVCLDHFDPEMNYGIYANGLLVESISERNILLSKYDTL